MSERIRQVVEPVITGLGYELWHLELEGGGGNRLLRLYIDVPECSESSAGSGITLEDCEQVSHEVGAALDVADPLPGAYRLEVSSPGLDRPLVTAEHFRRFAGERVRLTLYAPLEGRRRLTGVLQAGDDETVRVLSDGEEIALPRNSIAKARLAPELN